MKFIHAFLILFFFQLTFASAELTTREDIEYFQDISDYNLTKRHHINYFQDLSDYNITKRFHISSIQAYVSESCVLKYAKGCVIYNK
tara:strand:- start:474 stop:734 length:261 start_codon:yes stop_codon:yes gene_type:complete